MVNNYEYDLNSVVYLRLTKQIQTLKKQGKPLLIKINSHPCAGKSWFIQKYKHSYMGCKLLDFDHFKGPDQTSLSLMRYTKNTALLGTAIYREHHEDSGGNEKVHLTDVVYIHVIPRLKQLTFQIKTRQTEGSRQKCKWAKTTNILEARQKALSFVFDKNQIQVEPLFHSFTEGLKFCIDAYNVKQFTPPQEKKK